MKKSLICLVLAMVMLASCVSFVACNTVADNTQFYDAITKTLKLKKPYEGKSFLSEGIGEATLVSLTDGDTTNFRLVVDNRTVTIRYYCVDTPESTGGVEKWGKAASLFVKERLSVPGTQFVLEATGPKAETDNYGVRYLGYIWYKRPDDAEFRMLNLELVENGFSENKASNTSEYPYYDYFAKANNFAKKIKLRLYSELDDPLYSTDPIDVTLPELFGNMEQYYNEETGSGAKVRFYAYLESMRISETTTYTFVAVEYDKETGQRYQINVYAGYASAAASNMEIGHYYRIVGNLQKHNGVMQISGVMYNTKYGKNRPEYTAPTIENYFLTFNSDNEKFRYNANYYSTLYTDVTVVSSEVSNGILTIVGTASQRRKDGPLDEVKTFTFTVPVAEGYTNVLTAGKTFAVQAFQYEENSGKISIRNYSDITIR